VTSQRLETLRFVLNEGAMLAMMAIIAAILTAAMVMQYAFGELPCPLCLLQRVAMLGVCFGLMQNFRNGFSDRNLGYSLLFSGGLGMVAASAPEHRRGAVISAAYVIGYVLQAACALALGAIATSAGLLSAIELGILPLVALAVGALLLANVGRRQPAVA